MMGTDMLPAWLRIMPCVPRACPLVDPPGLAPSSADTWVSARDERALCMRSACSIRTHVSLDDTTSSSRSNVSATMTSRFLQLTVYLSSVDVHPHRLLCGVIVIQSGTHLSISGATGGPPWDVGSLWTRRGGGPGAFARTSCRALQGGGSRQSTGSHRLDRTEAKSRSMIFIVVMAVSIGQVGTGSPSR